MIWFACTSGTATPTGAATPNLFGAAFFRQTHRISRPCLVNEAASPALKPPSLKKIYLKLGYLGNRKNAYPQTFPRPLRQPPVRTSAMRQSPRPTLLAAATLATLLSACTVAPPTLVYSGPQTPIGGACDPATRATLTQRGSSIVLAPANGTLTLEGTANGPDITAQATLTGADRKPYTLAFTGRHEGAAIDGTLLTPRCRYRLTLARTFD